METMETEDMKIFNNMINKNYENFKLLNYIRPTQCIFNPQAIGDQFLNGPSTVIGNLKDGRSGSWWFEGAACTIYNLTNIEDKNALNDGFFKNEGSMLQPETKIGVKTLSKNGLDLMQSGFKGRGFKGITKEKKIEALASSVILSDYHIIVDSIDSPIVYFNPISSKEIMMYLLTNKMSLTIKRKEFYQLFYGDELNNLIKNNFFKIIKL